MQNKISKIQEGIVIGLIVFYFIVLVVNAVKAAAGLERLAVHHWPLFAATAFLGWKTLEQATKVRIIITAKRTARASIHVSKFLHFFENFYEKCKPERRHTPTSWKSAYLCTSGRFPSGCMIRYLKG